MPSWCRRESVEFAGAAEEWKAAGTFKLDPVPTASLTSDHVLSLRIIFHEIAGKIGAAVKVRLLKSAP
jgi:hypothetical protein